MSNNRCFWIALLLIFVLLLSGCDRLSGHVIINRDGSAELQISSGLTTTPAAILSTEEVLDLFRGYLNEHGFTLQECATSEGTELVARRHVDKAVELLDLIAPTTSTCSQSTEPLQARRGMLSDSYHCQIDLDLLAWLPSQITDWQLRLAKLILSSQKLTLQVTLPWTAKEHNADFVKDNGRTLGWNLAFGQPRQLEFLLRVPNRNLFLLVVGVLLTLLYRALAWLSRRKRK